MKKIKIVLSGSTGFIGSRLVKSLNDSGVLIANRDSVVGEFKLYETQGKEVDLKTLNNFEVIYIHLATLFSKDNALKSAIYDANVSFGTKLVTELKNYNLTKVIYTNTMYKFYQNSLDRDSYYSRTKQEFSEFLNDQSDLNKFNYEEIYLDNTFGINDSREKIIPLIVESVNNNKVSPIQNPNNFINLVHIEDVLRRINLAVNGNVLNKTSSFVNEKSIQLQSIYKFLNNYKNTNNIDISILKYQYNSYVMPYPKNEYCDYNVMNLPEELIKLVI